MIGDALPIGVDFVPVRDGAPRTLVEVKWNDAERAPTLRRFFAEDSPIRRQVVGTLRQARSWPDGDRVEPAVDFLATLDVAALTARRRQGPRDAAPPVRRSG